MIYLQGRYYLPELGRFVSPDPIVPDLKDPQAWNRYTYARNNPLLFVDPTGHCWGIAAGLRNTGIYRQTCINLDFALHIVTHPKATFGERVGAGSYIGLMAVAHVGAVAGTAVAGGACVVATSGICAGAATMPVASTAGTAGTAVCADGDCTNEARLAAQGVYRAGQYLAADGDPFNEIDRVYNAYRVSPNVIEQLKRLGQYKRFDVLNKRLNISEIKTVMFELNIDDEMIAGANGKMWEYSYGLLRYIHRMGLEDELLDVLKKHHPYMIEEFIRAAGGG